MNRFIYKFWYIYGMGNGMRMLLFFFCFDEYEDVVVVDDDEK